MSQFLKSNHLVFKLVEEEDAKFILELRKNENLNKYISSTEISVEQQRDWIKNYKNKEKLGTEFYFRIDKKDGEKLGFVRVYNIDKDSKTFTWGSWIIKEERPKYAAIESALIIYEYAFFELGMEKAIFDVRKENVGVLKFHNRFGAIKIDETELDEFFEIPKEKYIQLKEENYLKFIDQRKL